MSQSQKNKAHCSGSHTLDAGERKKKKQRKNNRTAEGKKQHAETKQQIKEEKMWKVQKKWRWQFSDQQVQLEERVDDAVAVWKTSSRQNQNRLTVWIVNLHSVSLSFEHAHAGERRVKSVFWDLPSKMNWRRSLLRGSCQEPWAWSPEELFQAGEAGRDLTTNHHPSIIHLSSNHQVLTCWNVRVASAADCFCSVSKNMLKSWENTICLIFC